MGPVILHIEIINRILAVEAGVVGYLDVVGISGLRGVVGDVQATIEMVEDDIVVDMDPTATDNNERAGAGDGGDTLAVTGVRIP